MLCTNDVCVRVVNDIIHAVQQNKDYLSKLDGEIGDGDHGVNLNKGFTFASELISQKPTDMSGAFSVLGNTLMTRTGGSIGPLYGTFFSEMGNACRGELHIDKTIIQKMLNSAFESVSNISNARQGDKTMMDVLIPAVEAFNKSVAEGNGLKQALIEMKTAAKRGEEETRNMVAKIGRASRLGERSRGILDPGAASMNLILLCFADSMIVIEKDKTE